MSELSSLAVTGTYLLAGGTLLGWPVALQHAAPGVLTRLGVREPRRLLQMHLDYVLMGLILLAVGLALPDVPTHVQVALTVGAIVNPLLFLPLAFRPDVSASWTYKIASLASFAAMSWGAVGAAWYATG